MRIRSGIGIVLALGATGLAAQAAAGGASERAGVRVTSSGNGSERHRTLPITPAAWQRPRVVMSLAPRRLRRPANGDRMRVSAELQLTNNCIHKADPHCVGPPYGYSPKINARIELSAGTDPTPKRAIVLGRGHERCGQDEPHREHHCVLVVRTQGARLRGANALCATRGCRLNLVASAHHRKADGGDRILIGGNRPDGSIPQDRGRLNMTLIRRGTDPDALHLESRRLRRKSVKTDLRRRSVLSVPLRHLHEGDGLEVSAALRTSIAHLPYTVRTTSHLVLASKPGAVTPDSRARRVGNLGGEIDESNGFNCPLPKGGCKVRKVGVMKIRRTPGRKMYANLVLLLGPKRARAHSGDAARLRGGVLRVIRYPAARHSGSAPTSSSTSTG